VILLGELSVGGVRMEPRGTEGMGRVRPGSVEGAREGDARGDGGKGEGEVWRN
jgi:hypothetical protein